MSSSPPLGLLLALGALALAGCVFALPSPRPVAPEQIDTALAPLERLGRFDGRWFHELEPGSLGPSHVHVLVHGWAPGWGERARAFPRLRSWEMSHDDPPFEPWVSEVGRAIREVDPHAIVLAYSWLDDAGTGRFPLAQRRAFAHTELHGRWLAEALSQALRDDFVAGSGRIHLVGHSYGARVVALAAVDMSKRPQHLTFFDAPDSPLTHLTGSQLGLAEILRELPVGVGPGYVFVDNYVSSWMGTTYHYRPGLSAVVDVVLRPPYGTFELRRCHAYPMEFYARTAGLLVGLGWGPLTSGRLPEPGCFQQVYGELTLARGCGGVP